jgi:hypothetical protein
VISDCSFIIAMRRNPDRCFQDHWQYIYAPGGLIVPRRRVGFGKFGKAERTKKVFEMDRRPSSFPSKVLQGAGLLGSGSIGSFHRLTLL